MTQFWLICGKKQMSSTTGEVFSFCHNWQQLAGPNGRHHNCRDFEFIEQNEPACELDSWPSGDHEECRREEEYCYWAMGGKIVATRLKKLRLGQGEETRSQSGRDQQLQLSLNKQCNDQNDNQVCRSSLSQPTPPPEWDARHVQTAYLIIIRSLASCPF